MFETKPLRLLAKVTMGQAPVGETYNTEGLGLPLLAGAGDFDEGRPNAKKFTTAPSKTCSVGDIVIGIRASIGDQVVADGNYCLGRGVAGIRARDGVDQRFLLRCLEWRRPFLESKAKGATFKQVNREDVESLLLPLPPLSEQRRIADILDKADALRAKRRAALALLDALTQSIFVEMFGGLAATTTLGSAVNEFRYGTSMKSGQEGPFVLRIPNVVGGAIDLRDLKRVRLSGGELHRLRLIDGDVLFVRSNGNPSAVGRCAVYQEEAVGEGPARSAPFVFASYLIRARLNSGIVEPTFIRDFLATPDGRRQLRAAAKTSAGQFNINIDGLSNVGIPLPSLKDQRRYAARVRAVEAHRGAQVRSLAHLDALFASLQHRAFRGEL